MNAQAAEKNVNAPQIIRGGQYGKRQRVEISGPEFWKLDTNMHAVFNAIQPRTSRGIQEICDQRQWPWRVLARRFREARDGAVPMNQMLSAVYVLEMFVRDLYEVPKSDRAA